jgi:hypothetical protein
VTNIWPGRNRPPHGSHSENPEIRLLNPNLVSEVLH